jgi:hypothetical protein
MPGKKPLLGKKVSIQNRQDYPIIVVGATLLSMQVGKLAWVSVLTF